MLKLLESHFNDIAPYYDNFRRADTAPLAAICEKLENRKQKLFDLGCGTGETTNILVQTIKSKGIEVNQAVGVDQSQAMIDHASRKRSDPCIEFIHANAEQLNVMYRPDVASLVTSFNSIHVIGGKQLMDISSYLLSPESRVAIYTRVKEHEQLHPWGRYFPAYCDYSKLPSMEDLRSMLEATADIRVIEMRVFEYARKMSVSDVILTAENRAFSTFSLIPNFKTAIGNFTESLAREYGTDAEISFCDKMTLIVGEKRPLYH